MTEKAEQKNSTKNPTEYQLDEQKQRKPGNDELLSFQKAEQKINVSLGMYPAKLSKF